VHRDELFQAEAGRLRDVADVRERLPELSSIDAGSSAPVAGSSAGWPEMKQRSPATTAAEKGKFPVGTPSPPVMYVWPIGPR
jgi:hypothetical protein